MRQQLIAVAEQQGVTVNVLEISKQNFLQMDAVFVTNSLIGLWPVRQIIDETKRIELPHSDTTLVLQQALYQSLTGHTLK